ncbi:ribosome recycling factor [Clostridium saccharobutylicum]|uniref:Ribosome-recycling factor n=2 Tax=Clostridium saccharobutylicum TaxID=169679 RepID=U5MS11_CLOSA|nr:ribosome recycling factor [Clostridium saccharobutylicum]AGX42416.1 ribosome-recycling factor Frr [Clostridium saccharobutylicum DSM 13864]AQR89698.1 ribosome-recycling factor [Clostridium saccharobutylicum]AQR99600.1 ribosome-recycling factor [Clostridium saccharobutylicum]AQS09330.1 ribosome-recycling factor [Clostridium saccharobutylicum]AQS13586.1 ribosome-recycling factor [Clostridium saccharobutylicum]
MIKDIIKNAEEKMKKTIAVLESDLSTMKAGRANPSMLDRIQVEYYGSMCPLSQVANVSAPEPRVLMITPWEKPLLKDIERAILKSDLGLNPSNDGSVIRLVIPELTEETRKTLVKNVKKTGEEAKVAIRSIRKGANDKIKALKNNSDVSEDEIKKGEDDVQKKTDAVVKQVDVIVAAKEKEVLSI